MGTGRNGRLTASSAAEISTRRHELVTELVAPVVLSELVGSAGETAAARRKPAFPFATAKAAVFDLASVPQVWRVASFVGLGLLMLGVAVGYAKVAARAARNGVR